VGETGAVLLSAGHRSSPMTGGVRQIQPANNGLQLRHFAEDLHKLITHLELRNSRCGFLHGWRRSGALLWEIRIKGREQGGHHFGRPSVPYEDPRQSEGVDGACSRNTESCRRGSLRVLHGVFKNFYNTDLFLNKRVSEQAVQASWNLAAGASATAVSLACRLGMKTSEMT